MCLTDLLLDGATQRNKAIFNALAEQPETAAAELVPALRKAHAHAVTQPSAVRAPHLKVLTLPRAAARMAAMPLMRGRFFDAGGRATFPPEHIRIAALSSARAERALTATGRRWAHSQQPGVALVYATSALALAGAFLAAIMS
jgi:chlorophyll(ide) b reductase